MEYEAFHANSYFNSLLKQVLTLADFLENGGDFAKSYLDNMKDQIVNEARVLDSEGGLNSKSRT